VGAAKKPAMEALQEIKNQPSGSSTGWNGYLIPSADGVYTFVTSADSQPADLSIGGQSVSFKPEPDDPSAVCTADPKPRWLSDPINPINLKSGVLYPFVVPDRRADDLKWKTAVSPLASIPSSALLPDYSSEGTRQAFVELYKAAIVVNGFNLSADEASYLQSHNKDKNDFEGFDFNAVTLQCWKRLQAYTDLRNNLPRTDTRLIDLFQWANHPDDKTTLSEKIAAATAWKQDNITTLIKADHFDLDRPEAFRNEINLVKLRQATIVADKIAVDIGRLFDWAKPGSKFWDCHQIAEDIRKAIRARFDEDVWEQVVKPLNDQLREHQKQALIAYLLVQQDLIDWGVMDADSLFEFFLIDVQMDACMQTSRIKQAISSVQLFIQRCLLGLEEKKDANGNEIGVRNNAIDRDRWEWMQRYRVWEANRKVFLYPENWIVPELRDDKSSFYKELESELLQKDINTQTVQDAVKSYLIKVDEVANLKVVGLFLDEAGNRLHVFASTRNAPYFFYYRYFQIDEKNWYPWEKVQVDIPSYDVEEDGKITDHGTYLIPVAWNNRLLIFSPQFLKKTIPSTSSANRTFQQVGNDPIDDHKPIEFWEIKMCWSEYRNGKWTQKQQSAEGVYHKLLKPIQSYIQSYDFVPRTVTKDKTGTDIGPQIVIDCYNISEGIDIPVFADSLGSFRFQGSQIRKSDTLRNSETKQITDFHDVKDDSGKLTIYSLQATNPAPPPLFGKPPLFNTYESRATVQYDKIEAPNAATAAFDFYHPFVHDLLGKMGSGTLDDLFAYFGNYYYTKASDQNKKADVYGGYSLVTDDGQKVDSFNELKRAYSLYNWEATFHAPMLLVDRLLKANQFEQALQMCHYILNPFAAHGPNPLAIDDPSDKKRFWQFPPFYEISPDKVLENLFLGL
jgi:Neuraminidase-like domain